MGKSLGRWKFAWGALPCTIPGEGDRSVVNPLPPARAMESLWHLGDASTEMPFWL